MKEINPDVLVVDTPIATLTREDIAGVKARALKSVRRRARVCAHRNPDDPVHEMVIAFASGCYIRPHKHLQKSESFHIIEGRVDIVLFDESGGVTDVVELGDYSSTRSFYYRADVERFHTVIIRSDVAVVHETTRGPFNTSDSVMASWAPDESLAPEAAAYLENLQRALARSR